MRNECPCKDCDNKGCGSYHEKCERYLQYRKKKDELLKQKLDANKITETHIHNMSHGGRKNWNNYKKDYSSRGERKCQ